MERKSWVCTLITQISLCFALFVALQIGRPQKPIIYHNTTETSHHEIYFISVRGGSRPPKQQTDLLKQATWNFQSFKVPWYTTKASKLRGAGYFVKQVKIPYGQTLDVIFVDTSSLQDTSNDGQNDQLNWLMSTLEASNASWRIIAGFHSIVACDKNIEQMETKEAVEPLHRIFLKYGVNAYLSGQPCANSFHTDNDISNRGPVTKGPYFTTMHQRPVFKKTVNGFLLHRVSSLEIVNYFVTLTGEVVDRLALQQWGKEAM
ncbi:hypothetical protein CsSME_00008032 [Camellia sinensis var. sinensis]